MDSFGVVSPRLIAMAKNPPLPAVMHLDKVDDNAVIDFMGAKVKNLDSLVNVRQREWMTQGIGVLVVEVVPGSGAGNFFQPNDVILSFNGANGQ